MAKEKIRQDLKLYLRILSYLRPYIALMALILMLNFLYVIFNALSIWMVAPFISTLFESKPAVEQQIKEQQEVQVNALIKKVLTQILTPNARERLANIRLARPQQAREIELVLIQLHQQGRMQKQLSDKEFKDLLSNLSKRKRDIKIKKR